MSANTTTGGAVHGPGSVTESQSAVCIAQSDEASGPGSETRAGVRAHARVAAESAITQGDRPAGADTPSGGPDQADPAELENGDGPERLFSWRAVLVTTGGYFTPPVIWSRPAPPLAELACYARSGPWAEQGGFWRGLGRAWWTCVGLPVTTVCRYAEWVCQRPGRFFTVAWVYGLLAHTDFAGWLLPWPSWLP